MLRVTSHRRFAIFILLCCVPSPAFAEEPVPLVDADIRSPDALVGPDQEVGPTASDASSSSGDVITGGAPPHEDASISVSTDTAISVGVDSPDIERWKSCLQGSVSRLEMLGCETDPREGKSGKAGLLDLPSRG